MTGTLDEKGESDWRHTGPKGRSVCEEGGRDRSDTSAREAKGCQWPPEARREWHETESASELQEEPSLPTL